MQLQTTQPQSLSTVSKIADSTDHEVLTVLFYVMKIIGVPDNKMPEGLNRSIMIDYIRRNWSGSNLNEIREAFDSAVENLFIDLNLYDRPFNVSFIKSVVVAYRKYKSTTPKPIEGINNNHKAMCVLEIIKKESPGTIEKFKQMGEKERPAPVKVRERTTNERLMDGWIRRFDQLDDSQNKPLKRIIVLKGIGMKLDDYISYRLNRFKKFVL